MEVRRCGRMTGKRVVVTGAGTGIGREVALEFAREGAVVALHYGRSAEGALSAVGEIGAAGGSARAIQADFRDVAQVEALARQAVDFLGGVDVVVNNAGITVNIPFGKVKPEQFDTLYQVNVRGQFFLTQSLLPELVRSRGTIINVSSVHGLAGFPEHTVYAGTKGAIIAYTRCLAIELAPKGVRVNAIAPGAVPVESHQRAAPDSDPSTIGDLIPAGFPGEPIDIARAAIFLASDDARYMVGQVLVLDGGTTSWLPFGDQFRQPFDAQFGQGYVPGV